MSFIKFKVIDKCKEDDPELFLSGYYFEIQVAIQEKKGGHFA